MKKLIMGLLALLPSISYASDSDVKISPLTLPYMEFCQEKNRIELDSDERNQYHSLLFLENLPANREVELQTRRKTVGSDKYQTVAVDSSNTLYKMSKMVDEKFPFLIVSGRGFLPGEKVDLLLNVDGMKQSELMSFVPNPIVRYSKKDEAKVYALIHGVAPTMYSIHFENFKEGESLIFESYSGGERIRDRVPYAKNMQISHMPGVMGKKGGKCKIIVTRESGEEMIFSLPWGEAFIAYLEGRRPSV